MFSSVRWPLALAFFLLTVLCVGATEMAVFQAVHHYYLETVEDNLTRDASFIAHLMERHMDQAALTPSERKMITDEMGRLSLRIAGRVCIINWRGDVLEDTARRSGENLLHRSEVKAALHGQTETAVRGPGGRPPDSEEEWETVDDPAVYVAVPMLAKGKVTGAIYASRSIADMQLFLLQLRERLYQVALGALAVGLILSLLLAHSLTAPLTRLTRAAQRLGQGHLDERIATSSRDEIGLLARTFNDMAGSLKKQHQTLLQFISDASHELKTPLASLRSLCDALEGGALQQPETAAKFLGYMHHDLDRMERLVSDLLQLHRLDQAALPLKVERLQLAPLLEELAQQYRPRLAPARLELHLDGGEVMADPERLRQILANLLENARRAVLDAPQGDPWVRLGAEGGQIWVEDNGIGLAPESLERIFDRFYRVDSSRSRDEGGTGLGLAITRGLAQAMGGSIRAESPGLGQGARLILTLPPVT